MPSVRRLGSDSILHLERNFYWTDIKEKHFYWTDIKKKRQRRVEVAILIDGRITSSFVQKPQIAVGNYLLIFYFKSYSIVYTWFDYPVENGIRSHSPDELSKYIIDFSIMASWFRQFVTDIRLYNFFL